VLVIRQPTTALLIIQHDVQKTFYTACT